MQRTVFILILFMLTLGCEDVIEVDLPASDERLVVNGIIEINRSSDPIPTVIKTSLSSGFFGENKPVTVTSVKIIVETINDFGGTEGGTLELYESSTEKGHYSPRSGTFQPLPHDSETTYFLSIVYNDRNYFARTTFVPATDIDSVEQGDETLFDEDDTEIIVTFTDDPQRQNLYVFNFGSGNFITTDDSFFQGEQYSFSYFLDENDRSANMLEVTLLGADREFFNYINLLNEQTEDGFNLFDTPAATIRGNVFDITDIDNRDQFDNTGATDTFALGYFAIVEVSKKTLLIE